MNKINNQIELNQDTVLNDYCPEVFQRVEEDGLKKYRETEV